MVVALIPVNRWLAQRIERASGSMMRHKDARVRAVSDLLRGMRQVKMAAWEACFVAKVRIQN